MLKKYFGTLAVFAVLMMLTPLLSLIRVPVADNHPEDKVSILDHKTGEVFEISLKDYIKGVVAAEIPASYETEAIKSQAVAAHTYALRQMGEKDAAVRVDSSDDVGVSEPSVSAPEEYSLSTDPEKYQAYASDEELKSLYGDNYNEYKKKISDAVDAVWDKVMVVEGEPIAAAFFAFSNGKTEDAANVWGNKVSYLVPVDSSPDTAAPNFSLTISVTAEEALAKLSEAYPDITMPELKEDWFKITGRSDSGYVTKVSVGDMTLTGAQIRGLFELRSSDFEVKANEDTFDFTVKGNGHGVGMSQYGANAMAKQGKSYEEILRHFYTGIELAKP